MVELVNDSFEYSKVTPSYISAVDIFSFSSAPANTSTKSDESMVSDQLVFTSLPGFDPPQTPGSTGPLLDDSNKSKEAIDNPTASSKEAAQPSYGSINDCLDGLNHKNFKEREKAQASLATFMYENVDNFKAVADTIEKNGSNLSEEQRDRWSKLLQHPFVGRLAVKGLAHDPAPVSVQDLESFVSNPEKLAKRIDLLKRVSDPKFLEAMERTSIREQHDLKAELNLLSQVKSEVDKNIETGQTKMPEALKKAMIHEISKRGGSPNAKEYLDRILKESPESIFSYIPNPISVRLDQLAFNYMKEGGEINSLLELRDKLERGDIKPKQYQTDTDVPRDELSHWTAESLTELRDSVPTAIQVQAIMAGAKPAFGAGGIAGGGPRAGNPQERIGGDAPGGGRGGATAPGDGRPPAPPSPPSPEIMTR